MDWNAPAAQKSILNDTYIPNCNVGNTAYNELETAVESTSVTISLNYLNPPNNIHLINLDNTSIAGSTAKSKTNSVSPDCHVF